MDFIGYNMNIFGKDTFYFPLYNLVVSYIIINYYYYYYFKIIFFQNLPILMGTHAEVHIERFD